jgi:hypothetical protein
VVGCTETIGERYLIPVLEAMLHQFPFRIVGFHCDNGSEFLNYKVVDLLNKLLVEDLTIKLATARLQHLNFHRPCAYATIASNPWGKRKRIYRHKDYRTPYEKLTSFKGMDRIPERGNFGWDAETAGRSPKRHEAARRMQKAKVSLLGRCRTTR